MTQPPSSSPTHAPLPDSEAFLRLAERERNLRLLVDGVQDYAIFQLDPQGLIASWNLGAQRIKGYEADEVIGRHFSLFYPEPARQNRWPEEELRWASARGRFEDEGWRVRKDGQRFWANVVITAIRDEGGQLLGFSKVTRDLTERRRQETLMREREENLRSLLEGVHDLAIYLVDAQQQIRSWNGGAQRLLGYHADEVLGQEVSTIVESAAASIATLASGALGPEGRSVWEGWLRRSDGTRFWAQVATTVAKRADGSVRGFVQVVQDAADRRRAASLETEGRRLTEFIALLSHELRNPLAPLGHALELLKAEPLGAQGQQCLALATRQMAHVTRLIEDLLDVSRVTTGKFRLVLQRLDLGRLLDQALEAAGPLLQAHGHQLHRQRPATQVFTHGDDTRLTQVVMNLVSNAAKYTPSGGRIEVGLQAAPGLALLTVADNGVGMSALQLLEAFEPFVQGEPQLARAEGGLGIGLTLVKRIVELHGGTVVATSPGPGLGTTVTVALPLAGAVGLAAPPEPEAPAESASLNVLVVDDNEDAAEAVVMLLRIEGHDVKMAHDQEQALALAAASRPEVVLLDLGLGHASGLDLARQLRRLPGFEQVRLIAVTGHGQPRDFEATRAAGFDAHLVKPVPADVLLQQLYRGRTG